MRGEERQRSERDVAQALRRGIRSLSRRHGDIAQLGERLPCKQEVAGSIPTISTKDNRILWLLRIDESVQVIERLHLVSKGTGNCTLKTEQRIKCDEKQGNREVFQRNLEESCEFLIVEHFC